MTASRYRNIDKVSYDDVPRHYESVTFPSATDLANISTIRVRLSQFDRLDQLAYKYLGKGEYWWMIALMNNIDWAYEFEPGMVIKIPINVEDVLRLI
jgi:phage tail protein X